VRSQKPDRRLPGRSDWFSDFSGTFFCSLPLKMVSTMEVDTVIYQLGAKMCFIPSLRMMI